MNLKCSGLSYHEEGFSLMIVIESKESSKSCRLEADSFSGGLNTTYISHTRSFVNVRM